MKGGNFKMVGFPKNLNTKYDFEYVREHLDELGGETAKARLKAEYQALIEGSTCWYPDKELASEAEGVTDDTHKVISEQVGTGDEATTKYMQMVCRTNEDAKIFRIGFTVTEVENLIKSL